MDKCICHIEMNGEKLRIKDPKALKIDENYSHDTIGFYIDMLIEKQSCCIQSYQDFETDKDSCQEVVYDFNKVIDFILNIEKGTIISIPTDLYGGEYALGFIIKKTVEDNRYIVYMVVINTYNYLPVTFNLNMQLNPDNKYLSTNIEMYCQHDSPYLIDHYTFADYKRIKYGLGNIGFNDHSNFSLSSFYDDCDNFNHNDICYVSYHDLQGHHYFYEYIMSQLGFLGEGLTDFEMIIEDNRIYSMIPDPKITIRYAYLDESKGDICVYKLELFAGMWLRTELN